MVRPVEAAGSLVVAREQRVAVVLWSAIGRRVWSREAVELVESAHRPLLLDYLVHEVETSCFDAVLLPVARWMGWSQVFDEVQCRRVFGALLMGHWSHFDRIDCLLAAWLAVQAGVALSGRHWV